MLLEYAVAIKIVWVWGENGDDDAPYFLWLIGVDAHDSPYGLDYVDLASPWVSENDAVQRRDIDSFG